MHALSLLQHPNARTEAGLFVVTLEQSLVSRSRYLAGRVIAPKPYYYEIASLLCAQITILLWGLLAYARLYDASCMGLTLIIMYGCLSVGYIGAPLCVAGGMLCVRAVVSMVVQARHYVACRWLCRRAVRSCCLSFGHACHYALRVVCYPCVPLSCGWMAGHTRRYGLRSRPLGVRAIMLLGVNGPGGPVCHW